MRCTGCNISIDMCVCNEEYDFTEECQDIVEDMAEIEAQQKLRLHRCKDCLFFVCRCRAEKAKK